MKYLFNTLQFRFATNSGKVIGAVEYVQDISKAAEMKGAIVDLSKAIINGQLDRRVDLSRFSGNYRETIECVNSLLDAIVRPISVAAQYVKSIALGEVPEKISAEYKGDFNELKNNLNTCIDAVNLLIKDANMLAYRRRGGETEYESRCLAPSRRLQEDRGRM